ncbi:MAG: (2Fe-2S) ferredoxin domain-containing protein [Halanaerobiales bacterium]|nr:(2Fe-2S) ferredoxin domain-containing protein [Halanaerobiales bacterium]
MLTITVCVGSSCHMRGSYQVIDRLEKWIHSNDLESQVELKANFCMENCNCGISMKIGDTEPITLSDVDSLTGVLEDKVFPQIRGEVK